MTEVAGKRILLSAYACEPGRGSEPGVGWNWALTLAGQGHRMWVLTRRNNQSRIEGAWSQLPQEVASRLAFIYYDLPRWASWWKKGGRGVQIYYALWQRSILAVAREAHRTHQFDVAHHLTFGVWRQPSLLYKLGIPLIFGPVGGGESAPAVLRRTLSPKDRLTEFARDLVNAASLLNPSLRACLTRAALVVCKTPESTVWVRRCGARSVAEFLEIGISAQDLVPRDSVRKSGEPLRCLFAGRLVGMKGVHLAVSALGLSRDAGLAVSLTIIGEGPMRRQLQRQVEDLGLQERVRFIPWLSQADLFQQYREHDVLLFPSLHDSSGNVVLEAMAHGLPVVCFKLGGPGVIVDKTCGIPAVPSDLDALASVDLLAKALLRLANDCEGWRQLHHGALARARNATWERTTGAIYGCEALQEPAATSFESR